MFLPLLDTTITSSSTPVWVSIVAALTPTAVLLFGMRKGKQKFQEIHVLVNAQLDDVNGRLTNALMEIQSLKNERREKEADA